MSESTVSKKIKKLPPEAKQQAQDFVDFLYERYVKDETKKFAKKSIIESSFFGMWKDCEDIQDSTAQKGDRKTFDELLNKVPDTEPEEFDKF